MKHLKPLNEANQSEETKDRMEGLVNEKNLLQFNTLLASLTKEWLKEGFDKEDILDYISDQIVLLSSVHKSKF